MLQRRIRRHLHSQKQLFFAICLPRFERLLERELIRIGGVEEITVTEGGVSFSGDFEQVYRINLFSRIATRVLLRVDEFITRSYPELYNKIAVMPWERYCGLSGRFRVVVSARKSRLHHSGNIEESVGAAVVKKLKSLGIAVEMSPDAAIAIFIRLIDDRCTVSVDSTGEMLYKRGYKQETAGAPLRENSAAALLDHCDGDRFQTIIDPFCGSGTFIIEAVLRGLSVAPGGQREFAFMQWPSFQPLTWNHLLKKATSEISATLPKTIIGSDIDEGAITAARANAGRAGVEKYISLTVVDCRTINQDQSLTSGLLISNLPYGKRIGAQTDLGTLYREFGAALRQRCRGWSFGFVVADTSLYKELHLPVKKTMAFSHGGMQVLFIQGSL
ncbi:MAG: hypothetical protein JW795_11925 [Chitinivibrionales bacterium]|nr:hypothetical protein [Chitinivibrionales bacterium]